MIKGLQRTRSGGISHKNIFQIRNDVLADKIIDVQQDTAIYQRVLHLLKLAADDPSQLVKHTFHGIDDIGIIKGDRGSGGSCRAGVGSGNFCFGFCKESSTSRIGEILAGDIDFSDTATNRSFSSTFDNVTSCTGTTPHGDLARNTIHVKVCDKVRHGLICNLDRTGRIASRTPHGIYVVHGFDDFIFTFVSGDRC